MRISADAMHLFWYFVWERQNVYHRRVELSQSRPWTTDAILADYKFTNVYRELDRTTIWYHDNIGGHYYLTDKIGEFPRDANAADVIFATFVHRLFNKIETMEEILPYCSVGGFSKSGMIDTLESVRAGERGVEKRNIFTSAHLVTGVRFGGYDDKLYNIVYLIDLIHKDIKAISKSIAGATSLKDLYLRSRQVNGFGPFLGYQYALDILNSGICRFSHDEFTVAGPGCKRGIAHVFPNVGHDIGYEEALERMRRRQHEYFEKYRYDFKFVKQLGGAERGIHLGNIENCFCEFSKYYKAFHGTGRPRNRFSETPTERQLQLPGVSR